MLDADPRVQSRRVLLTIWMIVRTPSPSAPNGQPIASSYSISADAFDRLPSLSFKRCRRIALRVPSGRTRGSRKHDRPPGAWASVRNMSDMGADVNHLCPNRLYVPSASGVAVVVLARTSEPPCFSVMDMPAIRPRLVDGTRRPKSYTGEASSGSDAAG